MNDEQWMRLEAHLLSISATLCGIEAFLEKEEDHCGVQDFGEARRRFKAAIRNIRDNRMPEAQ